MRARGRRWRQLLQWVFLITSLVVCVVLRSLPLVSYLVHSSFNLAFFGHVNAGTSVEMDPTHLLELTEQMEAQGQQLVGWYHSHPVFDARPSQKGEKALTLRACVSDCTATGSVALAHAQTRLCLLVTSHAGRPLHTAADNENQRNFQAAYHNKETGLEPWVGAIVSPYDSAAESNVR